MDERKAIIGILKEVGVFDFAVKHAGSEKAAVELFKNDFSTLMALCAGEK